MLEFPVILNTGGKSSFVLLLSPSTKEMFVKTCFPLQSEILFNKKMNTNVSSYGHVESVERLSFVLLLVANELIQLHSKSTNRGKISQNKRLNSVMNDLIRSIRMKRNFFTQFLTKKQMPIDANSMNAKNSSQYIFVKWSFDYFLSKEKKMN